MEKISEFQISIEQVSGYELRVHFDEKTYPDLTVDETPPLGQDGGPSPSRLLASAVASCLSASLIFCLQRWKVTVKGLRTTAKVEIVRNEQRRLRIGKIEVTLHPGIRADDPALQHCLPLFEDFCTVTQSVRQGIDVQVKVEPEPPAAS